MNLSIVDYQKKVTLICSSYFLQRAEIILIPK